VKLIPDAIAGSTRTGTGGVAALGHEVLDHPVKGRAIVKALARQKDEIVDGNGRLVGKKLDLDRPARRIKGCEIILLWIQGHFGRS
jgi:hypothetical protein